MSQLLVFLAVLSSLLFGCVSTKVTTPEGLVVERTAFYSDFAIKASRAADGSMKVEETQDSDQDAGKALLQLLNQAARSTP